MAAQRSIHDQIKSLIHHKSSNTILSHLKTWIHGNERQYFGNVKGNRFQIWRYTKGTQGFHPVIHGEIVSSDSGDLEINLTPKLNSWGNVQTILGILTMILLSIKLVPSDIHHFFRVLTAFGIVIVFCAMIHFIYRYESKSHLEELKSRIK